MERWHVCLLIGSDGGRRQRGMGDGYQEGDGRMTDVNNITGKIEKVYAAYAYSGYILTCIACIAIGYMICSIGIWGDMFFSPLFYMPFILCACVFIVSGFLLHGMTRPIDELYKELKEAGCFNE